MTPVTIRLAACDFWSGIVPEVFQVARCPGDPTIFISVCRIADFTAVGLPASVTNAGSGAGLTRADSVNAAIGESLERYAAAIVDSESLVIATSAELTDRGVPHTPPSNWTLFERRQLTAHTRIQPFDEHTSVAWVEGEDLLRRTSTWLPAAFVYMPLTLDANQQSSNARIGFSHSTGLACGRTRRQAAVSALCEIVERDAFTITWRTQRPAPRVRWAADSTVGRIFAKHFDRPGLTYHVHSTMLDLRIPSFFGYVVDSRCTPPAVVAGGAAHPSPEAAVTKTLVELAQGLAWVHNPRRQPSAPLDDFSHVRNFDDRMALYADHSPPHAFDFLDDADEIPLDSIDSLDGADRLTAMLDVMQEQHVDVIFVDLTSVDVAQCGHHVVRIAAPQCEVLEPDHQLPYLGGPRWRRHLQPGVGLNPYPHPYP